jgi:hypothetical protein
MFALVAPLHTAAQAQTFSTSGDCPGSATLSAVISPSATGQLYTGDGPGSDLILSGPCAGVSSGLTNPVPRGPATAADAYGNFTLAPSLPVVGCGILAQVIDQSTCTGTNVANLPSQNWFLTGSYKITDGQSWMLNPPTYTGNEACALLFGGVDTEYHSSTGTSKVTKSNYLDGWADSQYCTKAKSETWKKSDFYNCGAGGCSYSAYVMDHFCTGPNYCWHQ